MGLGSSICDVVVSSVCVTRLENVHIHPHFTFFDGAAVAGGILWWGMKWLGMDFRRRG